MTLRRDNHSDDDMDVSACVFCTVHLKVDGLELDPVVSLNDDLRVCCGGYGIGGLTFDDRVWHVYCSTGFYWLGSGVAH